MRISLPVTLILLAACGPPSVTLREDYAEQRGAPAAASPSVDVTRYVRVLAAHVQDDGRVDYAGLAASPEDLDGYIRELAELDFDALSRDAKLATLMNAYNAFTLRLILDHYPTDSIRSIPDGQRWKAERWSFAGETLSLEQIEHEYLRAKFKEPRLHFAINCASVGCPPLRSEPYVAERLEEQLEDQSASMHADPTWFTFDPASNTVKLTMLYSWYSGDFEQVGGTVLEYASRWSPELQAALAAGATPSIEWLDYDWSLNGR